MYGIIATLYFDIFSLVLWKITFMKHIFSLAFLFLTLPSLGQIHLLEQQDLNQWNIRPANYSGITPLDNGHYALVSDKEQEDGFFEFVILQDSLTGKVTDVRFVAFHSNGQSPRDAEGIAFCPQRNTVWISAEDDQRILEYDLNGQCTGNELPIPAAFDKKYIQSNRGFEALGYSEQGKCFWTTTESPTKGKESLQLLQFPISSIGKKGAQPIMYPYPLTAQTQGKNAEVYGGVVAITPLDNTALLVLERTATITRSKLGSNVKCWLYRWDIGTGEKTLQAEWQNKLSFTRFDFANYEGMCLGTRLADGRQTILLINDSQGGYGNALLRLKDYIRVGVME